jgi:hypothetical protein
MAIVSIAAGRGEDGRQLGRIRVRAGGGFKSDRQRQSDHRAGAAAFRRWQGGGHWK